MGVDANAVEAWAVGYKCASSACAPVQSLTLHWDGTNWNEVASPNPGSGDTHLNAVSMLAANDAWAAGSESNDGNTYGNVMMHWDGSAWTTVTVTNPGSANDDFFGLARLSANDIWAVGDFDNGSGVRTQTQHYTGPCASPTATTTAVPSATASLSATATAAPATETATSTATSAVSATATTPATATRTAVAATETPGLPTSTPTSCPLQFTDVPPGSTFYPYIHCLACLGIINGYPDGTFKPNNNVTRGQLSKIVSNSAGFNDTQTTQMFQDVPARLYILPVHRQAGLQGLHQRLSMRWSRRAVRTACQPALLPAQRQRHQRTDQQDRCPTQPASLTRRAGSSSRTCR